MASGHTRPVRISAYKIGEDIIAKLGMDHANAQNYIMAILLGVLEPEYENVKK